MRVGLHAPYSRQEATHMGLTLAWLAEHLSYEVSWLSSQQHEESIHPSWDDRVLSGRRHDFATWARRHRGGHILWFDVQDEKLALARKQGCQNTLIVLWHRLSPREAEQLPLFDHVVCPDLVVAQALQSKFTMPAVSHVPWSIDFRPPSKLLIEGDTDVTDIFVPVDGETATRCGPLLLHTLELLLAGSPEPRITIGHGKQWSGEASAALRQLVAARPQRVRVLRRHNWLEWREIQCAHDWVFLPSLQCNSGYLALEALQCGVPVMAFDVPPLGSIVKQRHNGLLLPCGITENWLGAPTAVINPRQLLTSLESCLNHAERAKLRAQDWFELRDRSKQFVKFWPQIWER